MWMDLTQFNVLITHTMYNNLHETITIMNGREQRWCENISHNSTFGAHAMYKNVYEKVEEKHLRNVWNWEHRLFSNYWNKDV